MRVSVCERCPKSPVDKTFPEFFKIAPLVGLGVVFPSPFPFVKLVASLINLFINLFVFLEGGGHLGGGNAERGVAVGLGVGAPQYFSL